MSEDITLEKIVPIALKQQGIVDPVHLQVGYAVVHLNIYGKLNEGVIESLPTRYNKRFVIRDDMPEGLPITSQTWLLPEQLKTEDQLKEPGDWYYKE